MTLCFICHDDKVLLGKKKRGFGEGWYNGFGGKLKKGETIRQAAVREIHEESGVHVDEDNLESVGEIIFHFDDMPDAEFRGNIFMVKQWQGEPRETDEMLPEWFTHDTLPLDNMWEVDKYWVPQVLSGKRISGHCYYTSRSDNGGKLRDMQFEFDI